MPKTGDVFFYVIVVSYNAGSRLSDTLMSVRRQTYKDYRVIVKDGMSDDDSTGAAREKFGIGEDGLSDDKRIRLVVSRDRGIYDAMNEALKEAVKEEKAKPHEKAYVYFLNCGDTLAAEDVLSRVAADAGDEGGILYGDVLELKTGEEVPSNPKMDDFACYRNVPCHQACFYDVKLMRKAPFNTKYIVRADYEHFLRLIYRHGAATRYLKFTVAQYEGGGFSETKENRERSERERKHIISLYLPAWKVRLFDAYRVVSLQKLREKAASSPKTAAIYNGIKRRLYGRKG